MGCTEHAIYRSIRGKNAIFINLFFYCFTANSLFMLIFSHFHLLTTAFFIIKRCWFKCLTSYNFSLSGVCQLLHVLVQHATTAGSSSLRGGVWQLRVLSGPEVRSSQSRPSGKRLSALCLRSLQLLSRWESYWGCFPGKSYLVF